MSDKDKDLEDRKKQRQSITHEKIEPEDELKASDGQTTERESSSQQTETNLLLNDEEQRLVNESKGARPKVRNVDTSASTSFDFHLSSSVVNKNSEAMRAEATKSCSPFQLPSQSFLTAISESWRPLPLLPTHSPPRSPTSVKVKKLKTTHSPIPPTPLTIESSPKQAFGGEKLQDTPKGIGSNYLTFGSLLGKKLLPLNEKKALQQMGYEWVRDLGVGCIGQLYLVLCKKDIKVNAPCTSTESEGFNTERNSHVKTINLNGEQLALKRMESQRFFDRESRIHLRVNHPNCILMYDSFQLENSYYIVMEYLNGRTDLASYFSSNDIVAKGLDDWTASLIIKHIAQGLNYLHSQEICHFDLHTKNIMPHCEDKKMVWKIIDFGLAQLKEDKRYKPRSDLENFKKKILTKILFCKGMSHIFREKIGKIIDRIPDEYKCLPLQLDTMAKVTEALSDLFPEPEIPLEDTAAWRFVHDFEE